MPDKVIEILSCFLEGNIFGTCPPTYVFDILYNHILPYILDSKHNGMDFLLFTDLAIFSYLHVFALTIFSISLCLAADKRGPKEE